LPRLRVVLDIDDTLVSTTFYDSYTKPLTQYESRGFRGNNLTITRFRPYLEKPSYYTTEEAVAIERPGLRDFLSRVSGVADMYLYTSGVQEYAEAIAACLDSTPEKTLFKGVFGREYMTSYKYLPLIFRDDYLPARTLLIDDRSDYHSMHIENGIWIPYFEYHERRDVNKSRSDDDNQLAPIADLIVNELQHLEDIRPVLNERYGKKLRAYLSERDSDWEKGVARAKDRLEDDLRTIDSNLKYTEKARKKYEEEQRKQGRR
jgi:NLI interacting factor-like phosphatase